nr:leucyl aminopeptidase [Derxia gummosa]
MKVGKPETVAADCVVALVHTGGALGIAAQALDAATGGLVAAAVKSGDISGKPGSTLLLRGLPGIEAQRVLLVGAGEAGKLDAKTFGKAIGPGVKALLATGAKSVAFGPAEALADRDAAWAVQQIVVALRDATYRFTQFKSDKGEDAKLASVFFLATDDEKEVKAAIAAGVALANGIELTKTLGNLPGNVCTPTYLAETAEGIAKEFKGKLKIEVLERKDIEALGMGSFLSVTAGTVEPPKFIVLNYAGGAKKAAPVVLVGKGITFDTGGISLKPGEAMDEMKYDMCGAGSVLGTFRALVELGLKLNVVGLIPTCENMPSGTATRPGDIVKSMSGQTIEILNTDAEGRLILCDALTYAERFKPAAVVDIATLTGACIIALGGVNSGLFSKNDELADQLLAAGKTMLDPAWRLPLDDEYQEQLKSNFADMANIGGRPAGSVTAACFLSRFTKAYDWAHLDIAGTAWKGGAAKGATGRPVPLLIEFLRQRAAA